MIGHGLWKAYIIKDALSTVDFGDYVFYVDSGAFYIHDIHVLVNAMENAKTDVMTVCGIGKNASEKFWTKRDAFILMDCDEEKYTDTPQYYSTFIFIKKSPESVALIDEFLVYSQDPRIITDMPNQLGKEDYEDFKGRRNDQTVWSLVAKKYNIKPFRDPSQWGGKGIGHPKDIFDRSTYPITFCHHRMNLRHKTRFLPLLPQLISTAERLIQDKKCIPKEFQYGLTPEFQDGLAYQVSEYIKQYGSGNFPANLPPPKEILASYRELNLPEPPFLKEAVEKL